MDRKDEYSICGQTCNCPDKKECDFDYGDSVKVSPRIKKCKHKNIYGDKVRGVIKCLDCGLINRYT